MILRLRRFASYSMHLPVSGQSNETAEPIHDSYLSTMAFRTSGPVHCADVGHQQEGVIPECGSEILEVLRDQVVEGTV